MIYSFSDATLERELGKRGNIALTAPPWLTHTHKDIFFFFPLQDIFKNSLLQYTWCVSTKAHQAPLLRPWGATDHGPLPSWHTGGSDFKYLHHKKSLENKASSLQGNWYLGWSIKCQEICEARFSESDKQASRSSHVSVLRNRSTRANMPALPWGVCVWELQFLKTWVGNHFGGLESQPVCVPDSLVSTKEEKHGNTI